MGDRLLAEVKKAFGYDRLTGKITWLIERNGIRADNLGEAGTPREDGYIQIAYTDTSGVRHLFRAHRLAWWMETGVMPDEIDHINRVRSDNSWVNLREVTRTQNNLNSKVRTDNVSGKVGVSWVARDSKWLARLTLEGRIIELGSFEGLDAAIAARRNGEMKHLGALCPS